MPITPRKKLQENKRVRKCHTFDPVIYKDFAELCEGRDAIPSRVIERFLIRQVNAI